ncbi:YggT family protein [Rhizosaccharibacter radicis]|uniref:YggT family protein n=1 Tax=Rhizosaccharibacter radicis TaxID=2782605 RepID=A0ABT1W2L7_9PROT|nr:YggT family protein [Acetobacteraceae bacterium KSS12]
MITAIFDLIFLLIRLYVLALLLSCLFSLLFAFNILDTRNRLVWTIGDVLNRITEPVLAPVRRILPQFGMVDLSPLVVLLVLQYLVVPLLAALERSILLRSAAPFYS